MILFNILIQQQGTRLVTCLICLSILSVSLSYLSVDCSSVCFICLSHFPPHLSLSSVYFTVSVYFLCLSHFTVPRMSVSSFCRICLSHLPLSSSISSFWCYLLVLCMAHLYVSLAICSVYFFCLPHLSGLSAVCLNCLSHRLSYVFLSLCLSIFLTYMPLHLQLTIISLHSLCMSFGIWSGLSRILPFSGKILFQ
jgi:hypothetical protein